MSGIYGFTQEQSELISDFILADRNLVLGDVEKPLKDVNDSADFTGKTDMWKVAQDYELAVDQALAKIKEKQCHSDA